MATMDSFDHYDYEYYKDYEEPDEEIITVTNLQAFEPFERHHIAVLTRRRNLLKGAEKTNAFGQGVWNELQALDWVLKVLDEITED